METTLHHPNEDCLRAFAMGTIEETAARLIRDHLKACRECSRSLNRSIAAVNPILAQEADSSEIETKDWLGDLANIFSQAVTTGPVRFPDWATQIPKTGSNPSSLETLPRELLEQKMFRIVRRLGEGGMGVVYLAHNLLLDRDEALKVMQTEQMEGLVAPERFLAEMRAAAKLNHPNIVASYSALQLDKLMVFCMEYVPGENLANYADRHEKEKGPFPLANACYYAYQTALGLQHAHEKGMVHRDIKPNNLMLFRKGHRHIVKILDFGLAKATSEDATKAHLTLSGQALGTPHYMAPEQIRDASRADIRADIYSLGCTLYHLLSGHPPFEGTSAYELLEKHIRVDARPIDQLRPDVPLEIVKIIQKMMAKNPALRFQKPGDVAQALTPYFKPDPASKKMEGLTPPGSIKGTSERKSHPPADQTQTEGWAIQRQVAQVSNISGNRSVPTGAKASKWPILLTGLSLLLVMTVGSPTLAGWLLSSKSPVPATLTLEGLPIGANLFLDGTNVNTERKNGRIHLPMEGGKNHQVEIKKDGFENWSEMVVLDEGTRKTLIARMTRKTPAPELPRTREIPRGKIKTDISPEDRLGNLPFRQLYDGRSLSEWVTNPNLTSFWKIDSHRILVGESGTSPSPPLITRRNDFRNFHLRMETRISDGTHGSVHFGIPTDLRNLGLGIELGGIQSDERHLGDITSNWMNKPARQIGIQDREWFLLEIIVIDGKVTVMAKGQTINEYQLTRPVLGAIALHHRPKNQISVRSIEIKELP